MSIRFPPAILASALCSVISVAAIAGTTTGDARDDYQRLIAPRERSDDLVPNCPSDGSSSCLKVFVDKADARLNLLYQGLMKQLNMQPDVKQALIESERKWIAFRDANCSVRSTYYRGALHDYMIQSCLLDLTKQRAEELRKFARTDQMLTDLGIGE
ncbi:lysozyme inhibitor LprI family protein [Burkholderia territorii]|uniref:lysozyme inhibitor LprI family protein n=1 Tax=Burkholderia territorii TaxID=1503055 RepID=UPI0018C61EA5|nr:lysozyme inhibitor LprI family protein [Burkholderia territorii]